MDFRDPRRSRSKSDDKGSEGDARIDKIRDVIRREFGVEIEGRERSLAAVDERLSAARKTLHRLRYAIVNRYYNCKKFEVNGDDIQNEINAVKDPATKAKVCSILTDEQKRIHPAIKSILNERGSAAIDDLPAQRPVRKKLKTDAAVLSQNVTVSADRSVDSLRPTEEFCNADAGAVEIKNEKLPMYVEPKGLEDRVLKINPISRNKQKKKFRIIIGNTSKYVGPASSNDLVTHRWLLYVRGPHLRPDISHIVESITVELHDSYAPQNVIKLKSSPFHLSKRGWGEFPVKLRIYFKNGIFNKPVNLIHNLKLDRYHTGLQTLGAETVADVWLYTDDNMIDKNEITSDTETSFSNEIQSPLEFENSSVGKIQNIKTEFPDKYDSKSSENEFEIVEIKQEPFEYDNMNIDYDISVANLSFSNDELSMKYLPDPQFIKNEHIEDEHIQNLKIENLALWKLVQDDHSYCKKDHNLFNCTSTFMENSFENHIFNTFYEMIDLDLLAKSYDSFQIENVIDVPMIDMKKIVEANRTLVEKVTDQSNKMNTYHILKNVAKINNLIIREYCKELISLFHYKVKKSSFIIKKYIKTLEIAINTNELILVIPLDKILNNKNSSSKCVDNNMLLIGKKVLDILEKLFHDSFLIDNLRSMVNLLLKRMQMVDPLASDERYTQLFPYVTISDEIFLSLKWIKRRNLLWTRAKMINNFLKNYSKIHYIATNVWTTKQILAFTIHHGFFPVMNISQGFRKHESKSSFVCSSQINTKTSYNILMPAKEEKNLITNNVKNDIKFNCNIKNEIYAENIHYISDSSDDEIEICNISDNTFKNDKTANAVKTQILEPLPYNNSEEKLQCQYIEKICSTMGVEIKNQNIGNNYSFGLVQKLMLSSLKNFIEDILRRAVCVKTETIIQENKMCFAINDGINVLNSELRNGDTQLQTTVKSIWNISEEYPYEITLKDIFDALKTREEFDFLTNFGLGLENVEYNDEVL